MASCGKITIRDLTESAKAQKDCYFCAYHSCPNPFLNPASSTPFTCSVQESGNKKKNGLSLLLTAT